MYNTNYFTDEAEVFREVFSWNKSQYWTTWNKFFWYLKSKSDIETQQIGNSLWKYYNFTTSNTADIKQWDILLINWLEYNVKETWLKLWMIVKYLYCILDRKN